MSAEESEKIVRTVGHGPNLKSFLVRDSFARRLD